MADDMAEEADVNWRRTLAISALVFALILVGGAIYLHIKEQQQEGAYPPYYVMAIPPAAAIPPETADIPTATATNNDNKFSTMNAEGNYIDSSADSDESHLYKDYNDNDNDSNDDAVHEVQPNGISKIYASDSVSDSSSAETEEGSGTDFFLEWHKAVQTQRALDVPGALLTKRCLQCICETITECRAVECGSGLACGLFRISLPYWIDAGRPSLQGVDDIKNTTEHVAHSQCVSDRYCAARTVAAHIAKYGRDCDHNGKIDCWDHAELHILGPTGCMRDIMPPIFAIRLQRCMTQLS